MTLPPQKNMPVTPLALRTHWVGSRVLQKLQIIIYHYCKMCVLCSNAHRKQ